MLLAHFQRMDNREDTKDRGHAKGVDEAERKAEELAERDETDLPGRANRDRPPVYGNHEALAGRVRPDDTRAAPKHRKP